MYSTYIHYIYIFFFFMCIFIWYTGTFLTIYTSNSIRTIIISTTTPYAPRTHVGKEYLLYSCKYKAGISVCIVCRTRLPASSPPPPSMVRFSRGRRRCEGVGGRTAYISQIRSLKPYNNNRGWRERRTSCVLLSASVRPVYKSL